MSILLVNNGVVAVKNILVAIDFSPVTLQAIAKAAEIACSFSCKLWLIHVAAPEPEFVGYDTGPPSKRDWRAKTLREEHRELQNQAAELRNSGIDVTPLLIQGSTVETIIQEARKLEADLIVLGSHGRSSLYKTLVGSVSEGVIRQASCPILLVPTQQE